MTVLSFPPQNMDLEFESRIGRDKVKVEPDSCLVAIFSARLVPSAVQLCMDLASLAWLARYVPSALGAYLGSGRCVCHCDVQLTGVIAEVLDKCVPHGCASRFLDFLAGVVVGCSSTVAVIVLVFAWRWRHDGLDAATSGAPTSSGRAGVRVLLQGRADRALGRTALAQEATGY